MCLILVKRCIYHLELRCYHNGHCGLFDRSSGNVICCGYHLNPFGFMMPRMSKPNFSSVWSKHLHGGS